jgi:mRNA interferase HicA
MKRRDLMKRLAEIAKQQGVELDVREGGSHTVVRIGEKVQPVPRHGEINEITAKAIIRKMGGK